MLHSNRFGSITLGSNVKKKSILNTNIVRSALHKQIWDFRCQIRPVQDHGILFYHTGRVVSQNLLLSNCSMSSIASINSDTKPELHRNVADYKPSVWGDYFIQHASKSMEFDENIAAQIETRKNDVRSMLVSKIEKPLAKVQLIDSITRLGLSYHFEDEIEEVLQHIYNDYVENGEITNFEDNLCSLAVLFRLLRQQGLYVSPNVFNKYKDEKGNFSERLLISDVEGMLSLYEATHIMIHGEDILEEALAFTTTHLESIANQLSHSHAIQVKHSLRQTIHKNLPRLEARKYISIYEQDLSHDENLLMLAKLDFNMLQSLYQKEFGNLCKWWKKLDVPNNLPYARDRIVECCFWGLGIYFEPQYSQARKIVSKFFAIATLIDDTFDAYGTFNELELFTKAIERWDKSCLDSLPDYMKFLYRTILDFCEEIEEDMRNEGRVYVLKYLKEEYKKYCQGMMTEAIWLASNYQPTSEEYISVSRESSGYGPLNIACYIGMGDSAIEDIFNWVSNCPKIANAANVLCRIKDDIVTSEFEQKRGHNPSFVECYMKQYEISRQAAIQEAERRVVDAWKDMTEECLRPTKVPMPFLMCILNMCRVMEVIYKDQDNFTNTEGELKTFIKSLLVDPVPI